MVKVIFLDLGRKFQIDTIDTSDRGVEWGGEGYILGFEDSQIDTMDTVDTIDRGGEGYILG